jgi:hypothetical protein
MSAGSELLRPRHKYDVFARRAAGEPLSMIGSIYAPNDTLARVYAFTTYNEEPWFELQIASSEAFLLVSHDDILSSGIPD